MSNRVNSSQIKPVLFYPIPKSAENTEILNDNTVGHAQLHKRSLGYSLASISIPRYRRVEAKQSAGRAREMELVKHDLHRDLSFFPQVASIVHELSYGCGSRSGRMLRLERWERRRGL